MLTTEDFHDTLRRMMVALREGDVGVADVALESILSRGNSEMKGKSLFYRGLISAEKGVLGDAVRNWSNALPYAQEGSFLRFQIELNQSGACEQQAKPQEAVEWLKRALETCCRGDEFAGVQALTSYLRLHGGRIRPEDEPLIACVCEKSWRVLELSGAPDSNDWSATAARLGSELEHKVAAIINE
jgi:hypothetical protein